MSDELDKLRATLKSVPEPDATRRASVIAAAEKNFAATQETVAAPRPMSDRPQGAGRIWTRILDMFASSVSRPALLAGSSLAVLALAVVVVDPAGWRKGIIADDTPSLSVETGLRDRAISSSDNEPRQEADEAGSDAMAPMAAEPAPVMMEEQPSVLGRALNGVSQLAQKSAPQSEPRLRNQAPSGGIVAMDLAPVEQLRADDRFPKATANGLKVTAEEPVSTFSVDVDTTSYAVWRMSVMDGYAIPPEALRIEEMVNYFDYGYPVPDGTEVPFTTNVSVTQTPWNDGTRLMQIGIQGYDVAVEDRPPMGLVFLIDTSGSMNDPMKLPLLIRSFGLLLNTLGDEDTVAIVTYAGSAGTALEPTRASDRAAILAALERLGAGGSTAGQAGLQQAYGIAENMVADGQSARVILATDGDFNVGISDPEALTDYVAEKRETGVALSVLGFGRGNYTDTIMQALAQNGNGVAAYIDSLAEAQKVLVEDVTGSLLTIASDVKIQVEFNPAQISEYRLIGYETRALNREDFNNDRVDAGDIGAGHAVTAIYEVTPAGSDAQLVDPLRYGSPVADGSDEWAFVKLRYKQPGAAESRLIDLPVSADTDGIASQDVRFATAVVGAARLMKGEDLGGWSLGDAALLAQGALGADPFGYRAEFLRLVRLVGAQTQPR